MSTATVTSSTTDIRFLDNIAVELVWTGTPTGTFDFQGSLDNSNFVSVSVSPAIAATGAADKALVNFEGLAFAYFRVVYTKTSGTGTLTAYICGKSI